MVTVSFVSGRVEGPAGAGSLAPVSAAVAAVSAAASPVPVTAGTGSAAATARREAGAWPDDTIDTTDRSLSLHKVALIAGRWQ